MNTKLCKEGNFLIELAQKIPSSGYMVVPKELLNKEYEDYNQMMEELEGDWSESSDTVIIDQNFLSSLQEEWNLKFQEPVKKKKKYNKKATYHLGSEYFYKMIGNYLFGVYDFDGLDLEMEGEYNPWVFVGYDEDPNPKGFNTKAFMTYISMWKLIYGETDHDPEIKDKITKFPDKFFPEGLMEEWGNKVKGDKDVTETEKGNSYVGDRRMVPSGNSMVWSNVLSLIPLLKGEKVDEGSDESDEDYDKLKIASDYFLKRVNEKDLAELREKVKEGTEPKFSIGDSFPGITEIELHDGKIIQIPNHEIVVSYDEVEDDE